MRLKNAACAVFCSFVMGCSAEVSVEDSHAEDSMSGQLAAQMDRGWGEVDEGVVASPLPEGGTIYRALGVAGEQQIVGELVEALAKSEQEYIFTKDPVALEYVEYLSNLLNEAGEGPTFLIVKCVSGKYVCYCSYACVAGQNGCECV